MDVLRQTLVGEHCSFRKHILILRLLALQLLFCAGFIGISAQETSSPSGWTILTLGR